MSEQRKTHEDRIRALEDDMKSVRQEAEATRAAAKETHDAVQKLYDALLEPQPGHSKSLLDRIAQVTIRAERGDWMLRIVIGILSAGATIAASWAALKAWAAGG